jgi:hypothetical protein
MSVYDPDIELSEDPDYYRSLNPDKTESGSWVTWVLVIVILIGVALFFVVLYAREKSERDENVQLGDVAIVVRPKDLDGAVTQEVSQLAITWDKDETTSNADITSYVSITPPFFNNNNATVSNAIAGAGPVKGSVGGFVITSDLLIVYNAFYVTTVATSTKNNKTDIDIQQVFMQDEDTIPPTFTIQPVISSISNGNIFVANNFTDAVLTVPKDPSMSTPIDPMGPALHGNVWRLDDNKLITASPVFMQGTTGPSGIFYLYNDSGKLKVTESEATASTWRYVNNHWCLSSSPSQCILYESDTTLPTTLSVNDIGGRPTQVNGIDNTYRWANQKLS